MTDRDTTTPSESTMAYPTEVTAREGDVARELREFNVAFAALVVFCALVLGSIWVLSKVYG